MKKIYPEVKTRPSNPPQDQRSRQIQYHNTQEKPEVPRGYGGHGFCEDMYLY